MTALFLSYFIEDWKSFYLSLINEHKASVLKPKINVKEGINSS